MIIILVRVPAIVITVPTLIVIRTRRPIFVIIISIVLILLLILIILLVIIWIVWIAMVLLLLLLVVVVRVLRGVVVVVVVVAAAEPAAEGIKNNKRPPAIPEPATAAILIAHIRLVLHVPVLRRLLLSLPLLVLRLVPRLLLLGPLIFLLLLGPHLLLFFTLLVRPLLVLFSLFFSLIFLFLLLLLMLPGLLWIDILPVVDLLVARVKPRVLLIFGSGAVRSVLLLHILLLHVQIAALALEFTGPALPPALTPPPPFLVLPQDSAPFAEFLDCSYQIDLLQLRRRVFAIINKMVQSVPASHIPLGQRQVFEPGVIPIELVLLLGESPICCSH